MSISTPCFFGVQEDKNSYEISIELTNRCNLNCQHCMNRSGILEKDFFSKNDLDNLVKDFHANRVTEVYISGGEPTLHPYFIEFIKLLKNSGITVLLATNAYDIFPYLSIIKENVDAVFISIDGKEETHDRFRGVKGAYKRTINNIRILLENDVPVRISTTVSTENLQELEHIIHTVRELGVYEIHFTVLVNVGRATEQNYLLSEEAYRRVVEKIHNLRDKYTRCGFSITMRRDGCLSVETGQCYGGKLMAHISANGMVSPCSYVAKSKLNEFYTSVWKKDNLASCLQEISKFQELCEERDRLFGHHSCAAMAVINSRSKSVLAPDPLEGIFNND